MKYLLGLILLFFNISLSFAQGPTQLCFTTDGDNCVPGIQSSASKVISLSTATTEIVPLVSSKSISVTSFNLVATAASTFRWIYGTGTTCGTGTTSLTGTYSLGISGVLSVGNGLGIIFAIPKGNALCAVTGGTGPTSGSVSYTQF